MFSKIDVINLALVLIGQSPINSIDEESSVANTCRIVYDITYKSLIALHPWSFALKRFKLQVENYTPPVFDFKNSYPLPADCIRIIQVDSIDYIPNSYYQVEGRNLLTNYSPTDILYISSDVNLQHSSPAFIEALSAKIAVNLCNKITGSVSYISTVSQIYSNSLKMALQTDNVSNSYVEDYSNWNTARYRYGN